MFEVMGMGERRGMGPRMLAALLDALAELVTSYPVAAAHTARKLAGIFSCEAEREDTERRAARAELLEILQGSPPAAAKAVAS